MPQCFSTERVKARSCSTYSAERNQWSLPSSRQYGRNHCPPRCAQNGVIDNFDRQGHPISLELPRTRLCGNNDRSPRRSMNALAIVRSLTRRDSGGEARFSIPSEQFCAPASVAKLHRNRSRSRVFSSQAS
jgi:hypothetical protein